MKILRQFRDGTYIAMVNEGYCCDDHRRMRGTFYFSVQGIYGMFAVAQFAEVRFCPFCGKPFEIIKEQ